MAYKLLSYQTKTEKKNEENKIFKFNKNCLQPL